MGVTGMVLTKETYIIHFGCFLCAVPVLFVLEAFLPSRRSLLVEPAPGAGTALRRGRGLGRSGPTRCRPNRRCSRASPRRDRAAALPRRGP